MKAILKNPLNDDDADLALVSIKKTSNSRIISSEFLAKDVKVYAPGTFFIHLDLEIYQKCIKRNLPSLY